MRRGQAALEFLVTYGWAFLIVLVMIGALAYFGVFNFNKFLPDKLIVSSGFAGVDYVMTEQGTGEEFSVHLVNELGKNVVILGKSRNVTCEGCVVYDNPGCGYIYVDGVQRAGPGDDYLVKSGKQFTISCKPGKGNSIEFLMNEGQKQKVFFSFDYKEEDGEYVHTITGELYATIGPPE